MTAARAAKSATRDSRVQTVLLSVTGLGLLFYLRKVRVSGLVTLTAGAVLVVALAMLAR